MNDAIKTLLLFSFVTLNLFASSEIKTQNLDQCRLDKNFKYISLSGPVSLLLEELELLDDLSLQALSSLHPLKEFPQGKEKIAGGIFLAEKTIDSFKEKVVWFDHSQNIQIVLENSKKQKFAHHWHLLNWNKLSLKKSLSQSLEAIKKYLLDCDEKIRLLESSLNQSYLKLENLRSKIKNRPLIFFLGELKLNFYPSLIMLRDGFVIDLLDNNLQSYPSNLAYVPWSQSELKKLKKLNAIFIGLNSLMSANESDRLEVKKLQHHHLNFSQRGLLIPGIGQWRFFVSFLDWFETLNDEFINM
jgi:hypothetical protein